MNVAPHPARFSDPILDHISPRVPAGVRLLDPFAGVGRIHEIEHADTWGVELEPEWACAHPRTIVADATRLPFPDDWFDYIATSCTYGNRMADHHNAQERCKACAATGRIILKGVSDHAAATRSGREIQGEVKDGVCTHFVTCLKCEGTGNRTYKRMTYRHQIGRPLHPNNSGQMQWGPKYRALHLDAWIEVRRVLRSGGHFLLNVSNHIRAHQEVEVVQWHNETILRLGFKPVEAIPIETQRMGHGQNREARVEHEMLLEYILPEAA